MKCMTRLALLACVLPGSAMAGFEYEGDELYISQISNARLYSLFLGLRAAGGQAATDSSLIVNRVRPTAEAAYDKFTLNVAWDLVPLIGNTSALSLAVAPANPLRIDDLDSTLHTGDGWILQHNLDQLNVRFLAESFEVRVGRQSIGHGSARIFPASDFFSSINPSSIDSEFKRGVDAVRFTMPIGEYSEIEFYAVGHDIADATTSTNALNQQPIEIDETDLSDGLYLGRWRSTFVDLFDLSVLAGMTYRKPTVALDLSGDLGGAGWYFDGALRLDPDAAEDSFYRASAGIDYRFLSGIRVVVEFHHNGGGELDTEDYADVLSREAYLKTEMFLLGQYYASLLTYFELTPLLSFNAVWMQNLTDGSALALPSLSWDFGEGTTLGLGGILSLGDRGYDVQIGDPLDPTTYSYAPRSEFGLTPHTLFTDVRIVF